MSTSITIESELLEKAREATGIQDTSTLVHEALRALVAREAARRLIAFGGSAPDTKDIPRRRPPEYTCNSPEDD
jgi:Arc/MetJ family transcription regulator